MDNKWHGDRHGRTSYYNDANPKGNLAILFHALKEGIERMNNRVKTRYFLRTSCSFKVYILTQT